MGTVPSAEVWGVALELTGRGVGGAAGLGVREGVGGMLKVDELRGVG